MIITKHDVHTPIHKHYRYRAKPWLMVLWITFFLPFIYMTFKLALSNERTMMITNSLELSVNQTTMLLWLMTLFITAITLMGVFSLITSYTRTVFIEITDTAISIPSWRGVSTPIRFEDITSTQWQEIYANVSLLIFHGNKKRVALMRAHMPSRQAFEEVVELIHSKVSNPS